jgi:hypothetical protein
MSPLRTDIEHEINRAFHATASVFEILPRDGRLIGGLSAGQIWRNIFVEELAQLDQRLGVRATPPADPRTVYFIRAGSGLIKIGVASCPIRRRAELQTAAPSILRLLGTIPGIGSGGETRLHAQFAGARSHGEWFRPVPELLAYIAKNASRP